MDIGHAWPGARGCGCGHDDDACEPMAAEVFVEITSDKGGFLKLYITVPVKAAAPQRPSPFLRILTDNGMLFSILNDNGNL